MRRRLLTLLVLCALFVSAACARADRARPPVASGGVMDLRGWNFADQGPAPLAGAFEFYWARFLSEEKDAELQPDGFLSVPAPWNDQRLKDGRPMPAFGYGTYRTRLLLPPGASDLGLFLPGQGNTVRVYVNGKLLVERGHPDKTPETSKPSLLRSIVPLPPLPQESELTFEVANFQHARGGLRNGITFGPAETLRTQREGRVVVEVFLFGSLILAAVYHIALFMLRRKDKAPLFFAAVCLFVAGRIIFTGEHYALSVVQKLPWVWAIRLEYLSYFLAVPAIAAFFASFFPDEFPARARNVITAVSLVFAALVLFTPTTFSSQTPFFFHIVSAVTIAFTLYALVRALRNGREGSVTTCIGFIIMSVGVFSDMSSHALALGWFELGPFGLFGFAAMQSISLSVRYTRAFRTAEELTTQLDEKVRERTQAAESARDEVSTLNELTRRINASSNLDQILDDVFLHIEATYGVQGCWAFFLNESSRQIYTYRYSAAAAAALPDEARQILAETVFALDEESALTFTIKRQRPLYVKDINRFDGHVTKLDAYMSKLLTTTSFLYAPLVLRDQCAGLIAFANVGSTLNLKPDQVRAIQRVCDQVAGAIYTARLLLEAQDARRSADRARAEAEQLNTFAKKVYSSTDLSTIVDDVFRHIEQNYGIEGSLLLFADHEKKELQPYRFSEAAKKHLKRPAHELLTELTVPFSAPGSLTITARRRRSLLVRDIHAWGRVVTESDRRLAELMGLSSFLHIPMVIGDELVGIICFSNFLKPLDIDKDALDSIERFCQQITGAIYNSRLLQKNSEARVKLEEADRAKTAFFQSVSHELRTPLTLIKGPVEAAWRKGEAIDAEHLKPVVFNTRRLLRLVNQLLDIQKVTAGRMEAKPVPISPTPFLTIVHNAFDPYTKARGIHLVNEVEDNLPVIEVDTDHLDKCLYNYRCDKASAHGGP
ncbi:MAG: GAF domain-containing protein [Spirochaetia bacterium]|nr:GAF domain-containing protein [Spirochaetia bacterium]